MIKNVCNKHKYNVTISDDMLHSYVTIHVCNYDKM